MLLVEGTTATQDTGACSITSYSQILQTVHATDQCYIVHSVFKVLKFWKRFSSKSRRPFFSGYNFQRFHEAMCRLFARRRKLPGQPPENGEIENRFVKKKNVFFFSTWLIDFDLKRLTQSWGVRTFGKILCFLRNRKMCYDAPPKWKSSTMRQVFWSQPLQSLIAICQTVFFITEKCAMLDYMVAYCCVCSALLQ